VERKLEIGNWKLGGGNRKLEIGNWKLENRKWKFEKLKAEDEEEEITGAFAAWRRCHLIPIFAALPASEKSVTAIPCRQRGTSYGRCPGFPFVSSKYLTDIDLN